MSRADGKAERDRIEAEIARRNAAARQTSAETSSRAVSSETREERHRRIEEKTRQALRDLDESDPVRVTAGNARVGAGNGASSAAARQAGPKTAASAEPSRKRSVSGQTDSRTARSSGERSRSGREGSAGGTAPKKTPSASGGNASGKASRNASSGNKGKKGKKKGGALSAFIIIVCLCVFGFSVYKIADWVIAASNNDSSYRSSIGEVENIDGIVPDWGGVIDNPLNHDNGGDSDTQTEIKVVPIEDIDIDDLKYIETDYSKLKEKNPDVKGWIYFPGPASIYGLPINAALLQGEDNYHYLDYDALGNESTNGCIYMSAGLDPDLVHNSNTMIYGHAKNPYAFAGLKYLNNAKRWYADANNHFIRIKTDNYYSIWQIFSWYETVDGGDFDRLETSNWAEYFTYLQGLNEIPSLGTFKFTDDDRIITLVTCKGFSNGRVAVHAKLVRYSPVS